MTEPLKPLLDRAHEMIVSDQDIDTRDWVEVGTRLGEAAGRIPSLAELMIEAADTLDASAAMQSDQIDAVTDRLRQTAQDLLAPAKPDVQEYYILHKVRWQPEAPNTDAPQDRDHSLTFEDDRIVGYECEEIGSIGRIFHFAENELRVK